MTKTQTQTFPWIEADKKGSAEAKEELLQLAAATKRGQKGTEPQKGKIYALLEKLERINPTLLTAQSELLNGEWTLAYSSDDLTRSSPFFWAFRKLTKRARLPWDDSVRISELIFAFTDRVPTRTIGVIKQTISGYGPDAEGTLKSEVELSIAGLKSTMTSTSKIVPYSNDVSQLTIETIQALDNDIDKVLPAKMSSITFPAERIFSSLKSESAQVRMKTTYLDDTMRISRNRFGHVFVFVKSEA